MDSAPRLLLYKYTKKVMGTHAAIKIIGYENDKDKIALCMNAAFNEILRIEKLFSHYNQESEVSILNKHGYLKNPSKELLYILDKAYQLYNLTRGMFDITVLPLLELLDKYSSNEISNEILAETRSLIDFSNIEFSGHEISFKKNGMKITLGGIAKGYAIDRAADILKHMGIKNALVDIGGDIKALSDNHNWIVGIRNPFKKDDIIIKVKISNQAIATSGNYEKLHIINPKKLKFPETASATIIAKNAIDADALATAAYIMGPDAIELVKKIPEAEALLIMKEGQMIKTSGFKHYEVIP
ncbi:MAG: FAD:protein FMN transferase [Nitrososphaerota archaeon]